MLTEVPVQRCGERCLRRSSCNGDEMLALDAFQDLLRRQRTWTGPQDQQRGLQHHLPDTGRLGVTFADFEEGSDVGNPVLGEVALAAVVRTLRSKPPRRAAKSSAPWPPCARPSAPRDERRSLRSEREARSL